MKMTVTRGEMLIEATFGPEDYEGLVALLDKLIGGATETTPEEIAPNAGATPKKAAQKAPEKPKKEAQRAPVIVAAEPPAGSDEVISLKPEWGIEVSAPMETEPEPEVAPEPQEVPGPPEVWACEECENPFTEEGEERDKLIKFHKLIKRELCWDCAAVCEECGQPTDIGQIELSFTRWRKRLCLTDFKAIGNGDGDAEPEPEGDPEPEAPPTEEA